MKLVVLLRNNTWIALRGDMWFRPSAYPTFCMGTEDRPHTGRAYTGFRTSMRLQ